MYTLRYATLADAADISAIHCSDIQQWYKGHFDDEGIRHRVEAPWEECSLIDRFEMGGAWMSPELCAIHLNRMLTEDDHIPLVLEVDGKVVGELEVFVGKDDIYGMNANLSVFYVHKEWRSQGLGSILLEDAINLVREIGCDTFTTYNPEIPDYYARYGLIADRTLKLVVLETEAYADCLASRRAALPSFNWLSSLKILSGRVLSARQLHWLLREESYPGGYAIPAAWRRRDYSRIVTHHTGKSFFVLRDRSGRGSWATVHLWGTELSEALIKTILSVGKNLGFMAIHFVVDCNDLGYFAGFNHGPPVDSTIIHCLKL